MKFDTPWRCRLNITTLRVTYHTGVLSHSADSLSEIRRGVYTFIINFVRTITPRLCTFRSRMRNVSIDIVS